MNKVNYAHTRSGKHLQSTLDDDSDLREENARLKKQMKELTAQRNSTIKQCTQLSSRVDHLQQELMINNKKYKEKLDRSSNQSYRIQELHFLNKELNNEIQQLRAENKQLLEKYKRSTSVVEAKYEELERNTFKKIELAMKRIKKTTMYLTTLSGKEIEKTKSSIVENLQKSLELLKGKHLGETYEEEVEELMSPIATIKEELMKKDKELRATRMMLEQCQESYTREDQLNKNILPQYKVSIEELQKNLTMARSQVAELELQRLQSKRKYQIRIRELEEENRELVTAFTKLKLQRKLYSDRIKEIEDVAQQEKQRLIDQNQMLKALYKTKAAQMKMPTFSSSHLTDKPQPLKQPSQRSRCSSRSKLNESKYSDKYSEKMSERDSSLISSACEQSNALKSQIEQVNRQIDEIQSNLLRELQVFKCR